MAHGGDIYRNKVNIDFSVNVALLGAPDTVRESVRIVSDELERYPDYNYMALREALAKHHNIKTGNILCGNGASELFMAAAHALRPKKVLIPIPSFYGYQWAFGAVSSEIIYYQMREENNFSLDEGVLELINDTQDIDLVVLANPNNPVGNYIDDDLLDKLLNECNKRQIEVILDECFMELSDNPSASYIDRLKLWDNLIVVRAFTKTFAIPALRLGYVVCGNDKTLNDIRRQLPEWNVSLAAEHAGLAALQDRAYIEKTRALIKAEREFLSQQLELPPGTGERGENCPRGRGTAPGDGGEGRSFSNVQFPRGQGIRVYPSVTNFIMFFTDIPLYDLLLEEGILIRDCSDFKGLSKGYYRVAVRNHEDNTLLLAKLRDVLDKIKNI
ncbi:MAG: aminotransferase class I/II-fold pyridoxal phosphate-dependent enzyme [Lachnospiraceae bacterium]|nr:aminotransferase class I/II-fold pyridoxal phosphate-dependent enzyme [Lachnospiraceae bacterium]